jgi:hypothetical protein
MNRFAANASITLFSCNTGADLSLLASFKGVFNLDRYGFENEVQTCTIWSGSNITVRGRMAYTPALSNLVSAGLASPRDFAKNSVWELEPDNGFFSRT